jgi:hypothetical protein
MRGVVPHRQDHKAANLRLITLALSLWFAGTAWWGLADRGGAAGPLHRVAPALRADAAAGRAFAVLAVGPAAG